MAEKRKTKRINKIMNVIISKNPIQQGMIEILSTCKNISRNGMLLELDISYAKEEIIYLRCINNLNTNHIDIKCQVVWVSGLLKNKSIQIGLKFINFSEAEYLQLIEF